jgi:hypothetical protein
MISMSTASWSSPRPATSIWSGEPVSNSLIDTLPSSSLLRRSMRWRLVRNLPSLPASGDVLTPKVMRSTGSSTTRRGNATGSIDRSDGVADLDLGEAGHHEQVAGATARRPRCG